MVFLEGGGREGAGEGEGEGEGKERNLGAPQGSSGPSTCPSWLSHQQPPGAPPLFQPGTHSSPVRSSGWRPGEVPLNPLVSSPGGGGLCLKSHRIRDF